MFNKWYLLDQFLLLLLQILIVIYSKNTYGVVIGKTLLILPVLFLVCRQTRIKHHPEILSFQIACLMLCGLYIWALAVCLGFL